MCHLILAMPLLALVLFWLLPLQIAAPIYAVVLLASMAIYWVLIRIMHRPQLNGMARLLNDHGEVIDVEKDRVSVRISGELWNAKSTADLHKGDRVRVTAVNDFLLTVVNAPYDDEWRRMTGIAPSQVDPRLQSNTRFRDDERDNAVETNVRFGSQR